MKAIFKSKYKDNNIEVYNYFENWQISKIIEEKQIINVSTENLGEYKNIQLDKFSLEMNTSEKLYIFNCGGYIPEDSFGYAILSSKNIKKEELIELLEIIDTRISLANDYYFTLYKELNNKEEKDKIYKETKEEINKRNNLKQEIIYLEKEINKLKEL